MTKPLNSRTISIDFTRNNVPRKPGDVRKAWGKLDQTAEFYNGHILKGSRRVVMRDGVFCFEAQMVLSADG